MTRVVTCDSCGRKVGTREDLTLNIKKGCQVEIIITCANCLKLKPESKPKPPIMDDGDIVNFLKGEFGWVK